MDNCPFDHQEVDAFLLDLKASRREAKCHKIKGRSVKSHYLEQTNKMPVVSPTMACQVKPLHVTDVLVTGTEQVRLPYEISGRKFVRGVRAVCTERSVVGLTSQAWLDSETVFNEDPELWADNVALEQPSWAPEGMDLSNEGIPEPERLELSKGCLFKPAVKTVQAVSTVAANAAPTRLRSRSALTNRLQKALFGVVGKSSTEPKLAVSSWMREVLGSRVLLLGTQSIKVPEKEMSSGQVHLAKVATEEGDALLCVELVAKLSNYACLRKRTVELLSSLRARALTWCRELELDDLLVARFLATTVAVSFMASMPERKAALLLGSRAVDVAVQEMNSLNGGTPRKHQLSNWDSWRSVFKFFGPGNREVASFPVS
jgi:hypothetical protein